jgi:hypothetical protein
VFPRTPVLGLWTLEDDDAQDYILGNFQPSLAGLVCHFNSTQHCVLGYSQPSLRDLIWRGSQAVRNSRE